MSQDDKATLKPLRPAVVSGDSKKYDPLVAEELGRLLDNFIAAFDKLEDVIHELAHMRYEYELSNPKLD